MKLRRNMLPPALLPAIPEAARGLEPCVRYTSIGFAVVFPYQPGNTCRCGCGAALPAGRRGWATDDCLAGALYVYWLWKGDHRVVRYALWRRDKGVCARCHAPPAGSTSKGRLTSWDAHHIVAVEDGGARLGLPNFETLCQRCHGTHHHGHEPEAIRPEILPDSAVTRRARPLARRANWRTRAAAKGHQRRRGAARAGGVEPPPGLADASEHGQS